MCHAQGIKVRPFLARMCLLLQEKQDEDWCDETSLSLKID
jgi:hypothetical protein